jgi:hypothetical protein
MTFRPVAIRSVSMRLPTILALLPLVLPVHGALLAPGPKELERAMTSMYEDMARTDAIGTALGGIHGGFAERLVAKQTPLPCEEREAGLLVARARALGATYRDAVQSRRADLARLERLWASPTVAPLLDDDDLSAAADLRLQVHRHTLAWLEMSAWQARHVEPLARRCAPELSVTAGVGYAGPVAVGETTEWTAVFGVGGGFVCPGAHPADGQVVLLPGSLACYGTSECTCTLVPVLPAAVIGP